MSGFNGNQVGSHRLVQQPRHRLLAALSVIAFAAVPHAPALAAAVQNPAEEAQFVSVTERMTQLMESGDAAGAAALVPQVVSLGERLLGAADEDYLGMLQGIAVFLAEHELRAEALPVLERLFAGREQAHGADHPQTVEALILLATGYASRGDYARTEPLLVRAVADAERVLGADHPNTLMALTNLGVLRLQQGRHAEAEPLLSRALAGRERVLGRDDDETLDTLYSLAMLYRAQARLAEADTLARRVLDIRERTLGPAHAYTLEALGLVGSLHFMRREYAEAESVYLRLRNQAQPLGSEHPRVIDAVEGLAGVYLMTGRLREAEPLARQALAARERVYGPDHPETLRSLSVLANVYLFSERYREAQPLLARAMTASRQRLDAQHPDFLAAAENVVFATLHANRSDASALPVARQLVEGARMRRGGGSPDLFSQLQRSREGRGRRGGVWYTLFADAAAAAARTNPAATPQLLGEVFLALQDAVAGEASASIARMAVRRYADRRGGDLGALVRERESQSERWRALSEQISQSFGAIGDDAVRERDQLRAERERVEARVAAIDARLRSEFPDYFSLVQPQLVQGPDAQRMLRPDEAMLVVVPSEFGTHVMAFTNEGAEWGQAEATATDIKSMVDRLRWDAGAQSDATPEQVRAWEAARPRGARPAFDRSTAHDLYRQVLGPLERVFAGKRRIYVVAGDSLAGLPFSLLVTQPPQGADDDPAALRATSWLGDRFALVHLPSVQSLGLLRAVGRTSSTGGFVGFGDPAFQGQATERGGRTRTASVSSEDVMSSARTGSGVPLANVEALRRLDQLPGTARELQAMGQVFGPQSSRIFTRSNATESAVYQADLSGARVLAFATHGLTPTDPLGADGATASEVFELAEPGLVLTPPMQASERDDGFLSASEVTSLRLSADWVILSACNTATGDAASAGLSQLARAFFYAGARNLLASHWPVSDDVAALMTVRTLQLEREGVSRAEAFQQAMREIRMDSSRDTATSSWAHPAYWAPFVLIGDGGS